MAQAPALKRKTSDPDRLPAQPAYYQNKSHPLGATVYPGGVNFSVFARRATGAELLLFNSVNDVAPERVIKLDPVRNRTYHYFHVFVPGIGQGQLYAWRINGPFEPEKGLRFNPERALLDPYGRCIARPDHFNRADFCTDGPVHAPSMKSVVVDRRGYDWEGDTPPRHPYSRTVIYEMHVCGFTRSRTSGLAPNLRGTYAGMVEKIPYLKGLGITAVELMPVFAFDPQDGPPGLGNYWGYAPISFFAPHDGYCSRPEPMAAITEFRDMVKAMHRAGIEVILDVVYNHTAEGGEDGPTYCYRGLSNETYYVLEPDKRLYANYTGCGNTLNANQSICRRMILDSLRYWVNEMHVDGFRFDLASILSRDEQGRPMATPPVLWDIESDPVLCNIKLIAEAWDAAGLYQVGGFVGDSWKEWNGKFRDDVRAFVKGDGGMVRTVAHRISGSPDIYGHDDREPERSVNFVTCHDGFTLNDLVSYDRKHNEANGEENRDGANDNRSWNCGTEGPTDDAEVEKLRNRQCKNLLALTLLSTGTPMFLMGDEVRRSQSGNNNAYCQNGEASWLDWDLIEKHAGMQRFVKELISLRLDREFPPERETISLKDLLCQHPIEWHGIKLNEPDWSEQSHTLAATFRLCGFDMHLMINAYWEKLEFEIPAGGPWRQCIDTSRNPPDDIRQWPEAQPQLGATYPVEARSVALLISMQDPAIAV